ncbi:MAG TPA: hypothetical protein ENK31_02705 [Nannocystis exedens]|nr:hypothetical protein [Nannocystis exedens]
MLAVLIGVLWGLVGGLAGFGGVRSVAAKSTDTPRRSVVSGALADIALRALPAGDRCRELLRGELLSGEYSVSVSASRSTGDGCDRARSRVYGRLARRMRPIFGIVERREESFAGVSVVLSSAKGCRRWLLREPGRRELSQISARRMQCSVRRLRGVLAVELVDREGERVRVLEVEPTADDHYVVRYGEVDAALRYRGLRPLREWSRIDLGEGGWAGSIDLEVVRRQLREGHSRWIARGRGVPGLFVVKYPNHIDADEFRLRAQAERALREERDYQAVMRGEMTPRRFLDRYPFSRFSGAIRVFQRSSEGAEVVRICVEGSEVRNDDCITAETAPPSEDPRP